VADRRPSFFDRALSAVGLQRAPQPLASMPTPSNAPRRASGRVYHAAAVDRLTADLFAQILSGNDEIKGDLRRLRGLSRRLFRDTAYGARYPKLIAEQALGADGVLLQARVEKRVGGLNRGVNRTLESEWRTWGKLGTATVCGKLSWLEVQYSVVEQLAIDGEILVRKVRGFNNAYGFALQMLDVDLLDETYTGRAPNGNRVVMGVELDKWGRPVAYHLFTEQPAEFQNARRRERVPAADIVHLFVCRRGATRGVPWTAPILLDASTLAAFLEAAVHAARIGASRTAAITRDKDVQIDDDEAENFSAAPDEVAPGQFLNLAPGESLSSIDWQYPTGEIDPFTKIILRSQAAGLNVSYAALSGDLSDANYSSLRAGMLAERDYYRRLQTLVIDGFCTPVYEAWREMALLMGKIPMRASITDYDRVLMQPRGWAWVDPKKDIDASVVALENRLTSRRRILAEGGANLEDVFEEIAEEETLMRSLGILPVPKKAGAPGAAAPVADATDDNADDDAEDDEPLPDAADDAADQPTAES